jgi:hypothetical protein
MDAPVAPVAREPKLKASSVAAWWGGPLKCARALYDGAHGQPAPPRSPPRSPSNPGRGDNATTLRGGAGRAPRSPRTESHTARGEEFEAALADALQRGVPLSVEFQGSPLPTLAAALARGGLPHGAFARYAEWQAPVAAQLAQVHSLLPAAAARARGEAAALGAECLKKELARLGSDPPPPPEAAPRARWWHRVLFAPPAPLLAGGATPFGWASMEVDFIFVETDAEGTTTLTICDAKSSLEAKLSHEVQVAVYYLALCRFVEGLPRVRVRPTGVVWLPAAGGDGASAAATRALAFDVAPIAARLSRWLRGDAAALLGGPRAAAPWHFDPALCGECASYAGCAEEAARTGSLALVPGLSAKDAAALRAALAGAPQMDGAQRSDIEDLGALLLRAAGGSAAPLPLPLLRRVLRAPSAGAPGAPLPPLLRAPLLRAPAPLGLPCAALPPCEDASLLLTLVGDARTRALCAWALRVRHGGGVASESCVGGVFFAGAPRRVLHEPAAGAAAVRRALLRALGAALAPLASRGASATVVVWSPAERELLIETLAAAAAAGEEGAELVAALLVSGGQALRLRAPPWQPLREGGGGWGAGGGGSPPRRWAPAPAPVARASPRPPSPPPDPDAIMDALAESSQSLSLDGSASASQPPSLYGRAAEAAEAAAKEAEAEAEAAEAAAKKAEAEAEAAAAADGGGGGAPSALPAPRVACLQEALKQLVALPSRASYLSPAAAAAALAGGGGGGGGSGAPPPPLPPPPAYDVWAVDADPAGGATAAALRGALTATAALLAALRRDGDVRRALVCRAAPLATPPRPRAPPTLARLLFLKQNECQAEAAAVMRGRATGEGLLRLRARRALDRDEECARRGWEPAALRGNAVVEFDVEAAGGGGEAVLARAEKEAADAGAGAAVGEGEGGDGGVGGAAAGGRRAAPPFYHKFVLAAAEAPLRRFDDFSYNASCDGAEPPAVGLLFAEVLRVARGADGRAAVTLLLRTPGRQPSKPWPGPEPPAEGELRLLSLRWTDRNPFKVEERLIAQAEQGAGSRLAQLLEAPLEFARGAPPGGGGGGGARPSPAELRAALCGAGCAAGGPLALDASQEACFELAVGSCLSLVWGPPGTGKTTFLARSIARLASAAAAAAAPAGGGARPFRALCTAMARPAIQELMRKLERVVAECDAALPPPAGAQSWAAGVALADFTRGSLGVDPAAGAAAEVHGDTVWGAWKRAAAAKRAYLKAGAADADADARAHAMYDLVVVDEASQQLVCDAAVAVCLLKPGGRLVVVGDTQQLRPIKGNSPYPEGPEPAGGGGGGALPAHLLHLSVLECLQGAVRAARAAAAAAAAHGGGAAPAPAVEGQLLRCYRMNEPLVSLSQRLYSAGFTSHFPGRQLARCGAGGGGGGGGAPAAAATAAALLLDARPPAARPAALLALRLGGHPEGAPAEALREHEAAAVAALVAELLREGGVAEGGGGAPPTPLRAASDIFVVTPHRLQRAAVAAALRRALPAATPGLEALLANVDTTEKMQGREAEVVIACWGVARDTFLSEMDFVLDLRRLNVALTRARSAAVLVLSDAVADPPLEVAASPQLADAMAFFDGFVAGAEAFVSLPPG